MSGGFSGAPPDSLERAVPKRLYKEPCFKVYFQSLPFSGSEIKIRLGAEGRSGNMADNTIPLDEGQETRQQGSAFGRYSRMMKMARTPTRDEYRKTVGITALGIILLGAVGFAIMWLMTYLPKFF